MKQRYFFEIAFDGSSFSGWQRQSNSKTVQETIENALTKVYQKTQKIHGCGRTDAGVHASQYYFHMDLENPPKGLRQEIEQQLPSTISILRIHQVIGHANAQTDAKRRTYIYHFSKVKNPFQHKRVTLVHEKIDLSLISRCLSELEGRHDFRNFCKRPDQLENTICKIYGAQISYAEDNKVYEIKVVGNRFLHHMMRLLVGNLIKVGQRRLPVQDFLDYLNVRKEPKYFELAPAKGLTLSHLVYPKSIFVDPYSTV